MKKKLYNTLIAVGCALAFTSCISDLDTEPLTDNILLPEKAWEDPNSYEQFLAKTYAGFSLSGNEGAAGQSDMTDITDQAHATFLRTYWNLQQLPTDEVLGAWDDETLRGLQFCQWNSNNLFCLYNYTRLYITISYINEFMRETTDEKLISRNVTAELKEKIVGFRAEARVLRAMNYYFLMDLFGNIPYVPEEIPAGSSTYKPEQKDRKFMFQWIETELKAIEQENILPPHNRANYGKVNNPTVWMVLAKLYLNAEKIYTGEDRYNDCLVYLEKLLGAGYTLDPIYKNMFGADNDLSPEIIFPIVFDGERAKTFGGTTTLVASSLKSDMNPETNFGLTQAWSGIRARESFSILFNNSDNRALFWKEDRTLETTTWYDFDKGWSVVKFTNKRSDGTSGSNNMFTDTDFPLYRLADVYLMYAEASLRAKKDANKGRALTLINELRLRANAHIVDDFDLNFILDERSRELYWEGHRRTDLIRFEKFTKGKNWPWKNGIYTGTPNIDAKYNVYPIPATELSANRNLIQNKGY